MTDTCNEHIVGKSHDKIMKYYQTNVFTPFSVNKRQYLEENNQSVIFDLCFESGISSVE